MWVILVTRRQPSALACSPDHSSKNAKSRGKSTASIEGDLERAKGFEPSAPTSAGSQSVPRHRETYSPAWETLSPSFRAEADAWLKAMSEEGDLLSETGPSRPLRPASIKTYRYTLRLAVAGLQRSGRDARGDHVALRLSSRARRRLRSCSSISTATAIRRARWSR